MAQETEKLDSASVKKAPSDVEAEVVMVSASQDGLKRQMKQRHITMISIGGVIGTGLFLGTASVLQTAGPVGMLLAYLIIGSICYAVMISLGEMIAFLPLPGGHLTLAERFVDRALSFTLGWLYWYNWTITLPAELSSAAVVMRYWDQSVNTAVWITMCLVVVLVINAFGAGAYGEAEFIFASIKVITISGLLILGLILDLGGGPNHDRIGFRYWKNPGPFVQYDGIAGAKGRFLGWFAVMPQVAFAYVGTEIVAIAGAEVKNPRENIPKAIRSIYVRLLLFYLGGVTVMGLLVPSNDSRLSLASSSGTAAASPFVIAISNAGIKVLPSIINAAILSSAWSASNSDLYSSSRALLLSTSFVALMATRTDGLALNGNAPSVFLKVTSRGLPWVTVAFSAMFGLLAFMGVSSGSGRVFGWFVNMISVSGLTSWFGIAVTYIRFHRGLRAQRIDRRALPYRSPFQPFAAWYAAIGCFVVLIFSGWPIFLKGHWQTDTFVTTYLPLMLFPILYIGAKYWTQTPLVPYEEMDFKSGYEEELDTTAHEGLPRRSWIKRARARMSRQPYEA